MTETSNPIKKPRSLRGLPSTHGALAARSALTLAVALAGALLSLGMEFLQIYLP